MHNHKSANIVSYHHNINLLHTINNMQQESFGLTEATPSVVCQDKPTVTTAPEGPSWRVGTGLSTVSIVSTAFIDI